ncbi:hypothetical protein C8J56DRAFT_62358 [Mycena floridula]|nr:hypothetical protein C8J56DRAFT_62358 [Mycena floridula]
MLAGAVPVDHTKTTGERPIWPVVLWIIFAEFIKSVSISSLVEFISIQENDLCSWDDEREQWLRDHFDAGNQSVNDWFDFYASQLKDEHGQLLDAIVTSTVSESRRQERISSIRSEIQVLSQIRLPGKLPPLPRNFIVFLVVFQLWWAFRATVSCLYPSTS